MAPKKSKRSASEDSSDSDSGPDDRNPPPKKSKPAVKETAKKSSSSSDEKEISFSLDNTRSVKVREFRGKLYVDIREYYLKNGEMLPGRKGISLSIGQWNKFKDLTDDIQEAIKKMS